MNIDYIMWLGRHTLETGLLIAAPMLLVCMAMGLTISLLQAVTSLKDMTLTIVPKLLAMSVTALLFGSWMLQMIMKFTHQIFNEIQAYGH